MNKYLKKYLHNFTIEEDISLSDDYNIDDLELFTGLSDENFITGHEKFARLKNLDKKSLGINDCFKLYEEEGQNTLEYLHKKFGANHIEFIGTIIRRSGGGLSSLYLSREDGSWRWDYYWLSHDRGVREPALVPASTLTSDTDNLLDTLTLDMRKHIQDYNINQRLLKDEEEKKFTLLQMIRDNALLIKLN